MRPHSSSDESSSLSDTYKIDSDSSCICEDDSTDSDDEVPRKCQGSKKSENKIETKKNKAEKLSDSQYELKYH